MTMPLTRRRFLENLGKTLPAFHRIAKGVLINEADNIFDRAFTAHNAGTEQSSSEQDQQQQKLELNNNCSLPPTPSPDEVFDFSQYMVDSTSHSGLDFDSEAAPSLSPSKSLDTGTPNLSTFFDVLTPNPLLEHAGSTSFRNADPEFATPNDLDGYPDLHVDYFSQFDEGSIKGLPAPALLPAGEDNPLDPRLATDATEPMEIETDTTQYTFIETSPADDERRAQQKPPRMRYPDLPPQLAASAATEAGTPISDREESAGEGAVASRARKSAKPPARRTKKRPLSAEDQQAKRDRFLFKNKVAAQKCRERKKSRTVELQDRYRAVQGRRVEIEMEIERVQAEAAWLSSMLARCAGGCGAGTGVPRSAMIEVHAKPGADEKNEMSDVDMLSHLDLNPKQEHSESGEKELPMGDANFTVGGGLGDEVEAL